MKEVLQKRFGEHRVLDIPVSEGDIPLLALDLELRTPVTVLVTNGLSDYEMPVHEKYKGREFKELYFCLPDYWVWEDLDNPNMNWVFTWIQKLAKHVIEKETWFGHGHTLPCGEEGIGLSNTMKQEYFILTNPILLEQELAPIKTEPNKEVHFLAIVPIFKKEFEYKQSRGTFKLMQKFTNRGVNEKLDDFRSSVLRKKWLTGRTR